MTYSNDEICRRLADYSQDAIMDAIDGRSGILYPITFDAFKKIMRADGWHPCKDTIEDKWSALIDDGLIVQNSNGKTAVNIDLLARTQGLSCGEKKKEKKNFCDYSHPEKGRIGGGLE